MTRQNPACFLAIKILLIIVYVVTIVSVSWALVEVIAFVASGRTEGGKEFLNTLILYLFCTVFLQLYVLYVTYFLAILT